MKVAIINYNAGNTRSVEHALERIGVHPVLSSEPEEIRSADKVIFPGVGHAASTMKFLKENKLDELIKSLKQPVLGICLGQQLMCSHSEEGDVECMNIFPVKVKKFRDDGNGFKIPQTGWNSLSKLKSPLFKDITEDAFVYFVHSYYCEFSEYATAVCDYILPFSAALHRDNFYATQFHPEKSADTGQKMLKNFIEI
jgi:glutamine amidotransferase